MVKGPFLRLWIAQTISLSGDFVAAFAVQVAVVFRMHGSAGDASGVLLVSLLPAIVLGPLAGVFADRWNPLRTMIVSDVARGALILMLPLVTERWQLYAVCFLVSCFSSFFAPAQCITIPLLVKREHLMGANARMQQTMQLARIVSPAAAGAITAALGESACYYADSLSFFASAALLAGIVCPNACPNVCPKPAAIEPRPPRAIVTELGQGLRFLFTNPKFSIVTLSLAAGTFAAGCFGALASIYVRDVLRAQPSLLAMIASVIALGTLAGSFLVSRLARSCEPKVLIGAGMLVVGASILLLAVFPSRGAALAGAAGIGAGIAVVMVAVSAMLQGETPQAMRGRVSSGSASVTSMAQISAITISGCLAARVGVLPVFLLSAAVLFATGVFDLYKPLPNVLSAE
jgi:predicted MFS family arabinose efflux permease